MQTTNETKNITTNETKNMQTTNETKNITTNETKNKWKCLLCKKKFSGDIPYNYHINNLVCQKQKKVYKCLICNKIFDQKSHFDEHSNSIKCNKDLFANNYDLLSKKDTELTTLQFNFKKLQLEFNDLQNLNKELIEKNKLLTSHSEFLNINENIKFNPKYDIIEDLFMEKNQISYNLFLEIMFIINEYLKKNSINPIKDILLKLKTYKKYDKYLFEHLNSIMGNSNCTDDLFLKFKSSYKFFRSLFSNGSHLLYDGNSLDSTFELRFKHKPDVFDL